MHLPHVWVTLICCTGGRWLTCCLSLVWWAVNSGTSRVHVTVECNLGWKVKFSTCTEFHLFPAATLVQICFANKSRLARSCTNEFPWHSWQEQDQRMDCGVSPCLLQPVQELYGFASYQSCRSSAMGSHQGCGPTSPVTLPDHPQRAAYTNS